MPLQEERAVLADRLAAQADLFEAEYLDCDAMPADRAAAAEFAAVLRKMLETDGSAALTDVEVVSARAFFVDAVRDAVREKEWKMVRFYADRLLCLR